jgi:hypothetical protein
MPVRAFDSGAFAVADIILPIVEGISAVDERPSRLRFLDDDSAPEESSMAPTIESRSIWMELMLLHLLLIDLGIVP